MVLLGSVEVEAVAGLKLLLLEPLEGFGPPGLGLHGLPFKLNRFARSIEWHYLFRLISFYTREVRPLRIIYTLHFSLLTGDMNSIN